MKCKLIVVSLMLVLAASMLTACNEKKEQSAEVTQQRAMQIAVEDAGHKVTEVTGLHAHEGERDGARVYEIHFSCADQEYTYVVRMEDGKILSDG